MSESMTRFARLAALVITLVSGLGVRAILAQEAAPNPPVLQEGVQAAPTAQAERRGGGEATLVLPSLEGTTVGGYQSRTLLMIGVVVSILGIVFGLMILNQLKNL